MSQFLLCDSIVFTLLKDCCSQWLLGLAKKVETQKVSHCPGSRQQEVVQFGCCHGNIDSCPLGRPAVDSNFREYVDHLHQNYLGS